MIPQNLLFFQKNKQNNKRKKTVKRRQNKVTSLLINNQSLSPKIQLLQMQKMNLMMILTSYQKQKRLKKF